MAKENSSNKVGFFKKISNYLKETKSELKKVTWPTKKQVINNTLVVLAFVFLVGACIWSLDFIMTFLINTLFSRV